jgi:hypothetical protein
MVSKDQVEPGIEEGYWDRQEASIWGGIQVI